MNQMLKRLRSWNQPMIALVAAGLLFAGCTQDHSSDPEFASWIGKTVKLTSTYKVCIPYSHKRMNWIESFFWWISGQETPYEMDDAAYKLSCRQDYFELISTLPPGTSVEVVKFEHNGGLMSYEQQRQVILRVQVADYDPPQFLVSFVLPFNENNQYQFPWEPQTE